MTKFSPSGAQAQAHMSRVWTAVFLSVRATIEVEREVPLPFILCKDQVRSLHIYMEGDCKVQAVRRSNILVTFCFPLTLKRQVDKRSRVRMPTVSQSNCAPQRFPPEKN